MTITKSFMEINRQTLHYGSLDNTLELLTRKGLVPCCESRPESKRKGKISVGFREFVLFSINYMRFPQILLPYMRY
jgi:hypothetical protein